MLLAIDNGRARSLKGTKTLDEIDNIESYCIF
jgi:hypothetical protein